MGGKGVWQTGVPTRAMQCSVVGRCLGPPHSSRPLLSPATPSSSQYPKVVGRPPSLHPQAGGRMRWGRFPQQEQGW